MVAPADVLVLPVLTDLLSLLAELGGYPPIYAAVTVVGVRGHQLWIDSWNRSSGHKPLPDYQPELVSQPVEVPLPPEKPDSYIRPVIDAFWNAFGYRRCPNFDADGCYRMKIG